MIISNKTVFQQFALSTNLINEFVLCQLISYIVCLGSFISKASCILCAIVDQLVAVWCEPRRPRPPCLAPESHYPTTAPRRPARSSPLASESQPWQSFVFTKYGKLFSPVSCNILFHTRSFSSSNLITEAMCPLNDTKLKFISFKYKYTLETYCISYFYSF